MVNSAGTLKFGKLENIVVPINHIWGAIVLGLMGGALGSLFITVNTYMSFIRKKYMTSTVRKVFETGFFGMLTVSVMTLLTIASDEC